MDVLNATMLARAPFNRTHALHSLPTIVLRLVCYYGQQDTRLYYSSTAAATTTINTTTVVLLLPQLLILLLLLLITGHIVHPWN